MPKVEQLHELVLSLNYIKIQWNITSLDDYKWQPALKSIRMQYKKKKISKLHNLYARSQYDTKHEPFQN
jgi:hypothetical protein